MILQRTNALTNIIPKYNSYKTKVGIIQRIRRNITNHPIYTNKLQITFLYNLSHKPEHSNKDN